MIQDVPLPGFEADVLQAEELRKTRGAALLQSVIENCIDVIDNENRGTLNPRSWTLLRLETAIKRLREHAGR